MYVALAQDRPGLHGPIPPTMVDEMDIATVAALYGVGIHERQQREAWAKYGGGQPLGPPAA